MHRKNADMRPQLPPLKPHERDFVIDDFLQLQEGKRAGDKVYSDTFAVGPHMKVRLMLFPRGTDPKQNCLAVFIEVLAPTEEEGIELQGSVDGDRLINWRYPDVFYYISCFDWREPAKSKTNHDRFGFSETETDRGWHNFLPLDRLTNYLGPGNKMVLRFGVLPHGLHYTTTETRTHHRGLKNHGTTCYLNSLLQCLYHVGEFCSSIYSMTTDEDRALLVQKRMIKDDSTRELKKRRADDPKIPPDSLLDLMSEDDDDDDTLECRSWTDEEVALALEDTSGQLMVGNVRLDLAEFQTSIARALQRVFYNLSQLETTMEPVQCRELIRSFGWNTQDQFTQHDAQELNRLLCDRLEDRMKNTPAEGTIKRLFAGDSEVYIECTEVDYKSQRVEVFYDLQLDVKDLASLEASLDEYVKEELLDGDNKYNAEGFGAQPAKKGIRFLKFPPVLQFHLKRFQFDLQTMDMIKVNDEFCYPESICFDKWCPDAGTYRLFAVNVHSGDVHEGHYYAFVRVPRPTFDPKLPGDVFAQCSWLKFDDEYVWRCTADAAIQENFGGAPVETAAPFSEAETRLSAKRNFSAYILFYIKESMARELLTPPDPRAVNPGMVLRIGLQEKHLKRHTRIKRDLEAHIKVHLVTEADLLSAPTGVWKSPADLPKRKSLKCQRDITAFTLWQQIYDMILQGELGEDLLTLYSNDKTILPGLFYFDYYEATQHVTKRLPPPSLKEMAASSGWTEKTCKIEELGFGVRLWNVVFEEPTRGYHPGELQPVTLRTNVTYMQLEALQAGKRPSMSILIHPLRAPHVTVNTTEIHALHESRHLVPLKLFDTFAESALDQNVYFFGILDLPNDRTALSELISARLQETWRDPVASAAIRRALPAGSRLASHLDRLPAVWEDVALYYEHRGFFESVPNAQSFRTSHNFRVLVVCFPLASSDDLHARAEQARSQLEAIDTSLRAAVVPESHPVDTVTFFSGAPTPLPAATANLPPTLPVQPPAATPASWLAALRTVRRVKVQLCDIAQYFGRCETLDAKPRDGAASGATTGGTTTGGTTGTAGTIGSGDSEMETAAEVEAVPVLAQAEADIDLSWQASFVLQWISLVLLQVNPQYLWLFKTQPRNSLYVHEPAVLSPDSLDSAEEEPTDLPGLFRKRGVVADVFRLFANTQHRFGISAKLARQCASSRCRDPPTLWFGLVPQKTVLYSRMPATERVVFVRLFDPAIGTLGAVCLNNVNLQDDVGTLIASVRKAVDIEQLQAKLGSVNATEWLQQDLDLVEHNACALRRASVETPVKALAALAESSILPDILLRVEPKLAWYGRGTPSASQVVVNVVLIDEPTGSPFGFPFSFVVGVGETFKSIRTRLSQMLTTSMPILPLARIYKSDDLKDESRKYLLKESDVVISEREQVSSLLIYHTDPGRAARRLAPSQVEPRRLRASLHIRG